MHFLIFPEHDSVKSAASGIGSNTRKWARTRPCVVEGLAAAEGAQRASPWAGLVSEVQEFSGDSTSFPGPGDWTWERQGGKALPLIRLGVACGQTHGCSSSHCWVLWEGLWVRVCGTTSIVCDKDTTLLIVHTWELVKKCSISGGTPDQGIIIYFLTRSSGDSYVP